MLIGKGNGLSDHWWCLLPTWGVVFVAVMERPLSNIIAPVLMESAALLHAVAGIIKRWC
jgi:hypothetical protein